jgi:hypothetical protein
VIRHADRCSCSFAGHQMPIVASAAPVWRSNTSSHVQWGR